MAKSSQNKLKHFSFALDERNANHKSMAIYIYGLLHFYALSNNMYLYGYWIGDIRWHHDTQYNNIQHNYIQHNYTQYNSIQHSSIQHNSIQHNNIQHQHNGLVCDTQHI
jgi:hypothetical protein